MILAMHAGFAFLELGTVRRKNQVNALVKILADFSISTIAYFFIGYQIAYGVSFFVDAEILAKQSGYDLTKFFFLLTFAAAIPAIVSGGIAERAKLNPQLSASYMLVGFISPFFAGVAWNQSDVFQAWLTLIFGVECLAFDGSADVLAFVVYEIAEDVLLWDRHSVFFVRADALEEFIEGLVTQRMIDEAYDAGFRKFDAYT